MEHLTEKALGGTPLDEEDVRAATVALLDEGVGDETKANFLTALSQRGETAGELAAFAEEFLRRAVDPELNRSAISKPLMDVCGTGGDKLDLFNVSTTAVFVLAAGGIAVVKHGNRGITSKSGGADVLEALGIRIDLSPQDFGRCVTEVGAGFLFAPLYHPAFKAVATVRKLLASRGQRTMFNLLGPLLNPARPDFQMIGVFDRRIGSGFAEILSLLGRKRAWVVHGAAEGGAGMDEFSTMGLTDVWPLPGSRELVSQFDPTSLGIPRPSLTDLQGGDASVNASILTSLLEGKEKGPKRDLVTLNAAAAFVIAGRADSMEEGFALANEVIDSREALAVLRRWQGFG